MTYLPPELLGFILACVIIEATPGPNMTYLAILASSHGRWAGISAVIGTGVGLLLIGLMAAIGLSALIVESPALYALLRWGGFVYLLWLAWDGWQSASADVKTESADHFDGRYFYRGLIVNMLNPKAGVFYMAMLPGFISPDHPVMAQTLLLTGVYVAIATLVHAGIVVAAHGATKLLSGRHIVYLQKAMALLLVAVALWFAYKTRG